MPRATPLPADERRAAILAATEPLLQRWGREVSTRQIAEAAGIAEGTIFRVFPSKETLIDTVVADAFDMRRTCLEIGRIDRALDLETRLEQAVEILQHRMRRVFALFHALRYRPQPDDASQLQAHRGQSSAQRRLDGAHPAGPGSAVRAPQGGGRSAPQPDLRRHPPDAVGSSLPYEPAALVRVLMHGVGRPPLSCADRTETFKESGRC